MNNLDSATLAAQLLGGHRHALARAITLAETGGAEARALLGAVYPHTGGALVVGVTGAPGAGKSTFVNALAQHWRAAGRTIAILAVDPSSPFSGGAILGDRIRMQPLGGDPGVFVRSMASRGRLGGIAHATDDAVALMDAAGFDVVVIETVGAGQSEVEIAATAPTTVVIETPGTGDDVQSIKAGILEIADVFVVNKADREGADSVIRNLQTMLRLAERSVSSWMPPVLPAVALRGEGIAAIAATIDQHYAYMLQGERLRVHAQARVERALALSVQELAVTRARAHGGGATWRQLVERVIARQIDPYSAADVLLDAP
ncbi:MAG: methylmalonyl Co-A mutase-associated GTPase MeaB [Roseiflexaceae bacterium]|nr:methylmalonyl Co-A mutase-associated GTPase MeaB [Roseiflexaceae bacterium]